MSSEPKISFLPEDAGFNRRFFMAIPQFFHQNTKKTGKYLFLFFQILQFFAYDLTIFSRQIMYIANFW